MHQPTNFEQLLLSLQLQWVTISSTTKCPAVEDEEKKKDDILDSKAKDEQKMSLIPSSLKESTIGSTPATQLLASQTSTSGSSDQIPKLASHTSPPEELSATTSALGSECQPISVQSKMEGIAPSSQVRDCI